MNTKQLHDDLVSMINLYGVIAIDDACEILNHYEKTDLTPSTLYPLLKFEVLESNQMFLVNEYFMLEIFLEEMEYLDLIELQEDIPFYKPNKKELLKYKEDLFQEETTSLKALKQFIIKHIKGDQVGILSFIDYLTYFLKDSFNLEEIPDQLSEFDCIIEKNHFDDFLVLCVEAHQNTRLWQNRGFTNSEILKVSQNKHRS
jgi:hypothetical protein